MTHTAKTLSWLAAALLAGLLFTGNALAHGNGNGYGKRPFHSPYRAVPHYSERHHGGHHRHRGYGYRDARYDYRDAYRHGYRDGRYQQAYRGHHRHRHGVYVDVSYQYAGGYRWCDEHRGYYRSGDYAYDRY